MNDWRPIHTAPKMKGHHLLMFGDGGGFMQCVFVGVWDNENNVWCEAFGNRHAAPTHWQFMPDSPESKQ